MVKFAILMCVLVMNSLPLYGQKFTQAKGDLVFSVGVSQLAINTFDRIIPIGTEYEYMVLPGIGVQGSVAATKDYFEIEPSILGHLIWFAMAKSGKPSLALGWIGLILAFERTNFHVPITKGLEFVPYISLWRIRYHWEPEMTYSNHTFHSGSIGLKFKVRLSESWSASPFGEVSQLYNGERLRGWQSGINIGYSYKARRVWR